MDNMMGQIKEDMTMRENKFSMWDKMTLLLHCLGVALNPKYYDKHYLAKHSSCIGLGRVLGFAMLLVLAPGGMKRNPPSEDREVIVGVLKAFENFSESEEEEN
uniref:Uncharacterized protein n=1 Tax=Lactuca sativa TaxID=4236 RepID=A0A9R1UXW3_LACSA|nr:hypothetical protein LSAT_V11C700368810 [Lactuca sativa]